MATDSVKTDGLAASAIRFLRKASQELSQGVDSDQALGASMAAFIELERSRYALDQGAQWRPGEPLKLLFAGYAGSRNTGADVRVEEMIRQFRHLLGDANLDLSLLTIDPAASSRYFRTVKQLRVPDYFPKYLFDTVRSMHGVVACEGSMFKSKFANALSTLMVGALGLARARGGLAIGYGGEAGGMDRSLERLVQRYCSDTFLITRNQESQQVLAELGIQSKLGTDTAWTFRPAPAEAGRKLLENAGWNGQDKILCICPINAFWWPVKPNLAKGALQAAGHSQPGFYRSVYFHADSDEIRRQQADYIAALAEGTRRLRARRNVFTVVVGMERLDRSACEALVRDLGKPAPVFVSDDHDMYELVSLLRQATWMVSSRYHALVTSMPPSEEQTGMVLSCGVTMDERIRNLMHDRGTPEMSLRVDDSDLAERLEDTQETLAHREDEIRSGIGETVATNLFRMGQMGQYLVDHIRATLPGFPLNDALGTGGDPWQHLPPLDRSLTALLDTVPTPAGEKRIARTLQSTQQDQWSAP